MERKKKKGDSLGDLRYETLIKIISSASVGCRGAYTRRPLGNATTLMAIIPLRTVARDARCAPCSSAFRSARTGNKKRWR